MPNPIRTAPRISASAIFSVERCRLCSTCTMSQPKAKTPKKMSIKEAMSRFDSAACNISLTSPGMFSPPPMGVAIKSSRSIVQTKKSTSFTCSSSSIVTFRIILPRFFANFLFSAKERLGSSGGMISSMIIVLATEIFLIIGPI